MGVLQILKQLHDRKCIIFSTFIDSLLLLNSALSKHLPDHKRYWYHGGFLARIDRSS